MIVKEKILKGFETAESRWARFGPYYAMFPLLVDVVVSMREAF